MGLAALASGGVLLGANAAHAAVRDTLPRIPVIRSRNGVLRATLDAVAGPARLDGVTTQGLWTYDGSYVGPCLRLAQGDRVDLTVRNGVPVPINTHFHGFWVDPSGDGDNVFVETPTGQALRSRFQLPRTHPAGLFWYHPHVHGRTNESVWNGLAGPIVVEGGVESLPQYRNCRDRLLILKTFMLDPKASQPTLISSDAADASLTTTAVNGAVNPTMALRPGETQIWRLGNQGSDGFFRIVLDGHRFTVLATDGHPVFETWTTDELVLVPGARFEVAVTGTREPGTYSLRTLGYDNGQFGNWPPQVLATVVVQGESGTPVRAPKAIAPRPGWLDQKPVKRRTFTLSESFTPETGPIFYINGKAYEHQDMHDPFEVEVDTVEEWVIRNDPSLEAGGVLEGHPFHIHVNHFAIVGHGTWDARTGETLTYREVDPRGLEDTQQVLPGEYVVLRMKFHRFKGLTVFHCHILFHEDMGMMGAFRIVGKSDADGGDHQHGH